MGAQAEGETPTARADTTDDADTPRWWPFFYSFLVETAMSDAASPPDAYAVVLADLRAKRAQIDQAIAAIEALSGGVAGGGASTISQGAPAADQVRAGMFLGMNIADAVKQVLALKKAPMGTPEITESLQIGGIVFSTDSPGNTVGSVLHRQTRIANDIISVGRGKWALAAWFPNPGRFKNKKGDKNGEEAAAANVAEGAPAEQAPKGEGEGVLG